MLQNPCKTLGFKKNMVYKIPPGGGGKPYPASGLVGFGVFPHFFFFSSKYDFHLDAERIIVKTRVM